MAGMLVLITKPLTEVPCTQQGMYSDHWRDCSFHGLYIYISCHSSNRKFQQDTFCYSLVHDILHDKQNNC